MYIYEILVLTFAYRINYSINSRHISHMTIFKTDNHIITLFLAGLLFTDSR